MRRYHRSKAFVRTQEQRWRRLVELTLEVGSHKGRGFASLEVVAEMNEHATALSYKHKAPAAEVLEAAKVAAREFEASQAERLVTA